MIIGLLTLLASLLTGGSQEIFYVDNIDKGVKEYVEDKPRKKELTVILKSGTKKIEKFKKDASKTAKELKQKDADRDTPDQWFRDFFIDRFASFEKLQDYVADERVEIQPLITDEEWGKIMENSAEAQRKQDAKLEKEESKGKSKDIFSHLEAAINENIKEASKRSKVIDALKKYEVDYYNYLDTKENVNVVDAHVLTNRQASKEELLAFGKTLNDLRKGLHEDFLNFYFTLKKNTNEEDWEPIIKEMNKLLG